jgi:hypothetical protein
MRYAVIVVGPLHLLCSRHGPDHLNCYEFLKAPKQNGKILIFDLVVYLICGGLVTAFLIGPYTPKDAFTGGLAWQGIVGGAVAGSELATYKKAGG